MMLYVVGATNTTIQTQQQEVEEVVLMTTCNKNIAELANADIVELNTWFNDLHHHISEKQLKISEEVIKERVVINAVVEMYL